MVSVDDVESHLKVDTMDTIVTRRGISTFHEYIICSFIAFFFFYQTS